MFEDRVTEKDDGVVVGVVSSRGESVGDVDDPVENQPKADG